MELSIAEWNLNFGADKNAKVATFLKNYLKKLDIIIFTEVIYNQSIMDLMTELEDAYTPYCSRAYNEGWHNQVIVMVKNDIVGIEIEQKMIDESVWCMEEMPDMVHLNVTYRAKSYQLIGVRVKIDSGRTDENNYKYRYTQFCNLTKYMSKMDNIILLGDFNNGMIKADSRLPYEEVKMQYEYTWKDKKRIKSLLRFYNFHLMKKELGNSYILEEVSGEDSSWGLRIINGQLNYGTIKNDQVIIKQMEVVESYYDWSFVREHEMEYYLMLEQNRYKKGNKIEHGYPDHAMLMVKVNLI